MFCIKRSFHSLNQFRSHDFSSQTLNCAPYSRNISPSSPNAGTQPRASLMGRLLRKLSITFLLIAKESHRSPEATTIRQSTQSPTWLLVTCLILKLQAVLCPELCQPYLVRLTSCNQLRAVTKARHCLQKDLPRAPHCKRIRLHHKVCPSLVHSHGIDVVLGASDEDGIASMLLQPLQNCLLGVTSTLDGANNHECLIHL
mmetsp:Transcript_16342/g.27914  ORF Transcript_16342/g.27914 Transcript_16342/m.27914 type:complete len:200 (-) Transcript_16342:821-1420(-)